MNIVPFQKFHIGQKGILIFENRALILLDEKWNRWDIPGGRISEGEDPKVAFAREILEETGIDISELVSNRQLIAIEHFDEGLKQTTITYRFV